MTDTAIVVGAGIAGLAAAGALADRFRTVIVLDRDTLPDRAEPRRGVPQGRHPHALLVAGQRAMEDLYPGVLAELTADGASTFRANESSLWTAGGILPATDTDLEFVSATRPLVERALRRRAVALSTVEVRADRAVSGLVTDASGERVTGVRLTGGGSLAADLVVDCTGRGSRCDAWLADIGFPAPTADEVKVGVRYASRMFRRGDDPPAGRSLLIVPTPPRERVVGVAVPVEDERWLIGIGGFHGTTPGTDEAMFETFVAELPEPSIGQLLATCEPLGDLVAYHFPSSRRRYFEKLRRVPAGFLALGDSICSFNPIYAQGMSVASMQAVELRRLLAGRAALDPALTTAFYRAAARIVDTPWQFAAVADFAYPETEGRRPPGVAMLNAFGRRIQRACHADERVRRRYTEVVHMIAAPSVLQTPAMLWRILRPRRAGTYPAAGGYPAAR